MNYTPQQLRLIELKKNAANMKLASDLIFIHEKFIQKMEEVKKVINQKTGPEGKKGERGMNGLSIKGEKGDKGDPGKDAPAINFEQVISAVLGKITIPKDGKPGKDAVITKDHIEKIAEVASKKVKIPETKSPDPINVIDEIMKMPEGKRLSSKHIDGLEQTLNSFRTQMSRGYLHGGGDTVAAGTGITISVNSKGTKIINATGSGGSWNQDKVLTRTNGTNYTLPSAPTSVLFLYLNGQLILNTRDYTYSGTAIVMTVPTISSDIVSATFL